MPLDTESGVTARYALLVGIQEFAVWLPLPVLVLHMLDRGLDLGAVGIAFGLRSLLVVLLEVPTGGLADAIGRKPIALASQALTLVSFVALLILVGPVAAVLYGLFQGVGAALHSGALDAWYVDALKRAREDAPLQRHLARVSVVQSGSMLAAAAVGGYLPSLASGWGLPWPLSGFGIALAAGIVMRAAAWVLTAVLVSEPRPESRGVVAGLAAVPAIVRDAAWLARRLPAVPYLLLAAGVGGLAMIAVETFWQPLASVPFGAEAENSGAYGLLGTMMGVAVLVGSLAVARWGDAFPGGSVALAAASQLVRGAAMVLLALHGGAFGVVAGLLIAYFALAVNNVPHEALLHEAIPDDRRSVMLSLNSLAFFFGTAVGSGGLGLLAARLGPGPALAVGAALTMLGAAAYLPLAAMRSGPVSPARPG